MSLGSGLVTSAVAIDNGPESAIADAMTVDIVYRFEVVSVNIRQGEGSFVSFRTIDLGTDELLKVAEIDRSCQRVSSGKLPQMIQRPPQFGDQQTYEQENPEACQGVPAHYQDMRVGMPRTGVGSQPTIARRAHQGLPSVSSDATSFSARTKDMTRAFALSTETVQGEKAHRVSHERARTVKRA